MNPNNYSLTICIGKTDKERSQENSEEWIYGRIVYFTSDTDHKKIQHGCNCIPYSTGEKRKCQRS